MVLPPKKKRKVEDSVDVTDDAEMTDADPPKKSSSSSSSSSQKLSMSTLDNILDKFVSSLENAQGATNCLLALKTLQRTCFNELSSVQSNLETKYASLQKHKTAIANLEYEEGHWMSKMDDLKASSTTPQLEALCREELDDKTGPADQVMEQYFGTGEGSATTSTSSDAAADHTRKNHHHHRSHQAMMNRLQNEIHQRGTMERDLAQKQKELTSLAGIEKKRAQFLNQLPDKLKDIEKASMPLQRWFQAQQQQQQQQQSTFGVEIPTGLSRHLTHTSSEREARLELAKALPGPLYTLLVQLQNYIDDYPNQHMQLDVRSTSKCMDTAVATNTNTNINTNTIGVWKEPPSDQSVVWQIPIPNVAVSAGSIGKPSSNSSNLRQLSIGFFYFENLHVVTAKVIGGDEKWLDLTSILQLNPQDTGDYQPSNISTKENTGHGDADANADEINEFPDKKECPYGKPYLWCNYLAGLQLFRGQHPQEQLKASSRVIVETMIRQVKANATLTYILNKVLPSHPRASALPPTNRRNSSSNNNSSSNIDATAQCLAKVTSFLLDKDATAAAVSAGESNIKVYKLICKRGNRNLHATVVVNSGAYPAICPPKWSLTGNTLQWGQDHGSQDALTASSSSDGTSGGGSDTPAPLHQSHLAAMEARVNNCDDLIAQFRKNDSDLSHQENEETFESHYYDWILTHQLRELLLEWDDWANGNENDSRTTGRTVRGRDRAKVE